MSPVSISYPHCCISRTLMSPVKLKCEKKGCIPLLNLRVKCYFIVSVSAQEEKKSSQDNVQKSRGK